MSQFSIIAKRSWQLSGLWSCKLQYRRCAIKVQVEKTKRKFSTYIGLIIVISFHLPLKLPDSLSRRRHHVYANLELFEPRQQLIAHVHEKCKSAVVDCWLEKF